MSLEPGCHGVFLFVTLFNALIQTFLTSPKRIFLGNESRTSPWGHLLVKMGALEGTKKAFLIGLQQFRQENSFQRLKLRIFQRFHLSRHVLFKFVVQAPGVHLTRVCLGTFHLRFKKQTSSLYKFFQNKYPKLIPNLQKDAYLFVLYTPYLKNNTVPCTIIMNIETIHFLYYAFVPQYLHSIERRKCAMTAVTTSKKSFKNR